MAGVFPRLRRGELPNSDKWELARVAVGTQDWDSTLGQFLAETEGRPRLLFLDQLDALDNASQLARFGHLLEKAVEAAGHPDGRLRLILGWRETVTQSFRTSLPRLAAALATEPLNLELPDVAARRSAIEKPVAMRGRILEPGLTERLLSDAGEDPLALALLQMVLPRLWNTQQRGWLTNATYDTLDGISGAFVTHVEAAYTALSAADQGTVKALLLRLVATDTPPGAFRIRAVMWEEIRTQPELVARGADVMASLPEARVVVVGHDSKTGVVRVTLGHRMHAVPWPRLWAWVREEQQLLKWREVLETSLTEWKAKKCDNGALLSGALLTEAQSMRAQFSRQLTEEERRYIDVSSAFEARMKRRQKIGSSVMAGLAIILVALWIDEQDRLSKKVDVAQSAKVESSADVLANATRQLAPLSKDDKEQAAQILKSAQLQLSKVDLSGSAADLLATVNREIETAITIGNIQQAKQSLANAQAQLTKMAPVRDNTRVYVQYTDEADSSLVDSLSKTIRAVWTVEAPELREESTCGDVRFFYSADRPMAERLRQHLASALGARGIKFEPRLLDLSGRFSSVRPGTLEIWLPPLGDLKVQSAHRENRVDRAELRVVPAGCFISGSLRSERRDLLKRIGNAENMSRYNDEKPKREIWQGAFYMYKYEVTNEQFARFAAATCKPNRQSKCPSEKPPGELSHPVRFVSWKDADAYCRWAGGRLPTEEEWEKAARGVDGRIWAWGNKADSTRFQGKTALIQGPAPVGSHPSGDSPYDISDMAGNLWEMTSSRWDADSHTMKGGSYLNTLAESRASVRWASSKEAQGVEYLGFRCIQPIASPGQNEAAKAD